MAWTNEDERSVEGEKAIFATLCTKVEEKKVVASSSGGR